MRLIKFSAITTLLGFICILVSRVAAGNLPEASRYSYPESLGRHYAQVSNQGIEGQPFGDGRTTDFKRTVAADAANPVTSIEIESTSIQVEVLPSTTDAIEITLSSNRVDPKEPVLVDVSQSGTLRVIANEGTRNLSINNPRGWFVLNFDDDDKPKRREVFQVRIPKTVTTAQIRTVSGDGVLATTLTSLQFQSTSGDFEIRTRENPLARVEQLTIGTTSGSLQGPGRFDRLRFNSVSGDVDLKSFDRVLEIDAQTTSGDLEIRSSEPVDAQVDFTTTTGHVRVEPFINGGTAFKASNAFKLGKGTARIKFKSISGDIEMKRLDSDDSSSGSDDDDDDNEDSAAAELDARSVVLAAEIPHELRAADSSFLECVARLAISEDSRLGATSVKACVKLIADKHAFFANAHGIAG